MREVIFFGFGFKSGQDVTIKGRELWTTNDWYKWHPQIKPSRLYQIHANKSREKPYKDKHGFIRMVDYWETIAKYPDIEIIMGSSGLCPHKYRIFKWKKAIDQFGPAFFRSTFSFMFVEAIWEKVDKILFRGIDLCFGDEYQNQVPGMLRNIDKAREMGIEVIAQKELIWRDGLKKFKPEKLEAGVCKIYGMEEAPELLEELLERAD